MVTGEPLPVAKAAGAAVVAGTINGSGVLFVTVSAVGGDTVLAKIMQVGLGPTGATGCDCGRKPPLAVRDTQMRCPAVQAFALLPFDLLALSN
jgi:hypothetical protein